MTPLPNNKRIAKNTLLLYIRTFFTMFIALYTSRIVLQALGVNDFGIYNVIGGFVGMFSLISASLTSSTQRFITFELGKEKNSHPQKIFSTAITIHVLLAILIIIIAESVGIWFLNEKMNIPTERLIAANWVFQFSIATFVLNLISIPYNATIIAHEKMSAFAYISLCEAILKLIIAYCLTTGNYDKLITYSALMFIVALIIRLIYGTYCSKHFEESKYIIVKEKRYYSQLLGFSGWNILGSSSTILTYQGINILLNLFFGVITNAARGIAGQVESAVNQFASNFTMAINPQITKAYASGNHKYMMELIIQGTRYSFYLLLFFALPILFETEYILKLWLKTIPDYTIIFIRLSICYTLCQSFSSMLYVAMLATGKIRDYQLIVGGLALMSFPLVYILFRLGFSPQFGYYATIFISTVCFIARIIMLKKIIKLPVKYFLSNVVLKVLSVTVIASILPFIITIVLPQNLSRLIINTTSTLFYTSILVMYIGISKQERTIILQNIKNKFKIK